MKLFHRSAAPSNTALRRPALVTHVEAPPQGAPHHGALSRGNIRVMVDLGSGPVEIAGTFRFADDHWLVRGMEVTVLVDPARPTEFDVDWTSVASMADRVAANHPALADPFATGRRVAQALGLTREDTGTRRQDRFAELMTAAAAEPPVAGKLRAVVLVATIRGRMEIGGSDPGPSTTEITVHRASEAVLAVNVPGRPPYAVFVRRFKFPRRQSDLTGGGLPALVSAIDPSDVEVQWDDVPSVAAQLADRMSASMSAAQDRMARQQSFGAQIMAAMYQQPGTGSASTGAPHSPTSGAEPPDPGMDSPPVPSTAAQSSASDADEPAYPPAGPAAAAYPGRAASPMAFAAAVPMAGAGLAALAPQMREMMIDNLRRTLRYVSDPAQRRMILDQYRALGVDIDGEGLDG
jgi:hypothetical protein